MRDGDARPAHGSLRAHAAPRQDPPGRTTWFLRMSARDYLPCFATRAFAGKLLGRSESTASFLAVTQKLKFTAVRDDTFDAVRAEVYPQLVFGSRNEAMEGGKDGGMGVCAIRDKLAWNSQAFALASPLTALSKG